MNFLIAEKYIYYETYKNKYLNKIIILFNNYKFHLINYFFSELLKLLLLIITLLIYFLHFIIHLHD